MAFNFVDPLHPLAQQDFEPAGIVLFISELLAQADYLEGQRIVVSLELDCGGSASWPGHGAKD